jgi:hypothetical protein
VGKAKVEMGMNKRAVVTNTRNSTGGRDARRQADREAGRQEDRKTERQEDRKTGRHENRKTGRK